MDITHLITPYKLGRPVLTGSGEAGRGYSYLSAMMGSSLEARIAG